MRILALADLHATPSNNMVEVAARELTQDEYDVVAIAGDISDWGIEWLFKSLGERFHDIPVVFCLGNHEFAHRGVAKVLDRCRAEQEKAPGNLHCLDVKGPVEINGVTFGGNVLWYDGTLGTMTDEDRHHAMEYIHPLWLDHTIKDFNPRLENARCVESIMKMKDAPVKVLVTHTVPHKSLNWFETEQPDSQFNIYSGMADLIGKLEPDVAICGHTHKRVVNRIGGCRCFNIGNDYNRAKTPDLKKEVIEI